MSQSVTEFVYLRLKSSVRPEDPSNAAGKEFLSILEQTKAQSGYNGSAWGRTHEDENSVIWMIDWADARGSCPASLLSPLLEAESAAISIYTSLHPPVSKTDLLTWNPVTEVCALAFPSSLSADERHTLMGHLAEFRGAVVQGLEACKAPVSWSMGQVERPGRMKHAESASGEAEFFLLVVGWKSVEAHMEAKETSRFLEAIAPIREMMLPPLPELGMKHVRFQKVD
ncbi:hypothetical protein ASPZODRAFT_90063 [Penicilliopsis zonata CBS 506.65]|uniref:ABM domain-containing protein n=1 Tax=Penicilliopsis zonata CBS 506.65 TaxID=1073090 RepID=A0A1L9SSI9_9EURO|nr:hypothetical protein ASPZODRAFT_90063 [Penicilliopsis zonata CBS 506.65]OJJ50170.1 hypothetical protein ASPZODRAFT_90063 [Penicilliopsis zonata CBS 506.65]